MAIEALVKPFLALPIFRNLKPAQLEAIVNSAERIVYRPGDMIVMENHTSEAAILVVSGRCVRLSEDAEMREDIVPEGSLIAELAMVVETVHPATIIAKDQVRALRLTREKMHDAMMQDPSLARHFSSCILSRLQLLAEDLTTIDAVLANAADPARLPRVSELSSLSLS
ncbi:cyclic nucleotide-binding domain-containing protein [Hyphomicrobium methylovorum]|uniref:cyclic nucleotide-binding domain-containing protein n=1 Tax=Hyphomicrobium methylovorum TaxID=84 RepID=UPI0015E6454C|nr:cyclic nucleotide-binding domain-containing protein [Hyphomicrobium methylovorum]MBA2126160.1 cyclic nucleotide-binding domain-containing protein [Hyphomicrobium methylovorum]